MEHTCSESTEYKMNRSKVIYTCTCSHGISLICKECLSNHIMKPFSHTLVSLNQAPISSHMILNTSLFLLRAQYPTKPKEILYPIPKPHQSHTSSLSFLKPGTNELMTYNCITNRSITKDLSNDFDYTFNKQCVQMFQDGSIIIAGFYDGRTYHYKHSTRSCPEFKPLMTYRTEVKLYFHNPYLYAFGGSTSFSSNIAERMHWPKGSWEKLPDMKERRIYPGVLSIEDRIYLLGGASNTTIEYYDIPNNIFRMLPNIRLPMGGNVAAVLDDKIYIITSTKILKYSIKFELELSKNVDLNMIENSSNIVKSAGNIYYFDANNGNLSKFDSRNMEVRHIQQNLFTYTY